MIELSGELRPGGLLPVFEGVSKALRQGWECPVCKTGNAPWMPYCGTCRDRENAKANHTGRVAERVNPRSTGNGCAGSIPAPSANQLAKESHAD